MEHDKPIFSGNLLVSNAGKILIKKSWQMKYCLLFKASKFGVERLEIYDNVDTSKQSPIKIITLQDCIKIIPRNPTYFSITTKAGIHEFEALTTTSMNEWVSVIQSIVFPDDSSRLTSIEEDNDLYCPSGEGVFNVKLHSSPASTRCGLESSKLYLLVLTDNAAQLRNCHDYSLLFTWPYCFIRRYGYKSGRFMFEAGRKCESGEGIFYLEHSDQQEIFRCFASKIKSMKKMLSNETLPSIFDSDNSFHAVFNMEARSRSPLPLSLATSLNEIEQNASSIKSQISFPDISENIPKAIVKPKPAKPPRKNLQCNEDKQVYETLNKYDKVEYRSDAWKTLGVNDVNHEEGEPDEDYMSWGQVKKDNPPKTTVIEAPKVISEPNYQEDYDKLNFFGSTSKNVNTSTYKQIKIGTNESFSNPPSFNDYDEVEIEPISKDKTTIPKGFKKQSIKIKDTQIDHQFHNDEPYAIISKPKRV